MNDLLFAYLLRFEKEEIIRVMEAALRWEGAHAQNVIMEVLGAELMPHDDILQWKMPTAKQAIENVEKELTFPPNAV